MRTTCLLLFTLLSAGSALAQDRLLWERRVDMHGGLDIARSVAVSDGKVIVAGNMQVPTGLDFLTLAYDAASGRPLWSDHTPLAAGLSTRVFTATSQGAVFTAGYAPNGFGSDIVVRGHGIGDGRPLWEDRMDKGRDDLPTGFAANERAVVVVGYGGNSTSHAIDFLVRAYQPATGALLWEDQLDVSGASDLATSVAITDRAVYVLGQSRMLSGSDLVLRAYDLETGLVRWDVRLPGVSAGVVRAQGGRVFIAGATGGAAFTAAFRARTGELLWQERSNEPWVGTVQVQGGRLIELGGRSLRARAVSTGAMLWETAPPSDLSTTQFLTAMDAGVYGIFVAGVRIRDSAEADIVVRAYDLDGALLWTDQAARSPNSGVSDIVLQGKRLYVVGYAAAPQNRLNTDFLIRAYRVGEDPRLKAPPLKANRS
jgi:outer membrane protein assembly factor BamB